MLTGQSLTVEFLEKNVFDSGVVPEPLKKMIKSVQFYQWPESTAISCNVTLHNGHQVTGFSRPRDDAQFKAELGIEAALVNTFDAIWNINAYLYRGQHQVHPETGN